MEVSEVEVSSAAAPAVAGLQASAKGLAQRAHLAVLWTTGFSFFCDLLQFGVTLTLVRILPPEAYGQFGLVTTTISFLTVLSFREVLAYTIQVRDDAQTHYQDQFTGGAVIQGALFVVANLVAFVLRFLPAYAPVAPLVHLMSVLFLLDLPSQFRVVMLERALDWRRLRTLHGLGLLVGAGLSVTMALAGFGVYALLVPILAVPLVISADLFFAARWRPTWNLRWDNYRPAFRFGVSRLTAASFVSSAGMLETSWLAGVLGFASLGLYNRAVGLSQLSCQRVSSLLTTSLYPVLTKIEPRTDRYRRASAIFLRSVTWVVVPVAALLSIVAYPVVRTIYGAKWLAAVPLVPLTLAIGAAMAIVQTAYILMLAHQQQRHCLRADMWRLAGTVIALVGALPFGLKVYLVAMMGVHLVSLGLVLFWLIEDGAVAVRGVVDALVPPLLVMAAIGVIAETGKLGFGIVPSGYWQVFLYAGVSGALYFGALRVIYHRQLEEIIRYLPRGERIGRLMRFRETA